VERRATFAGWVQILRFKAPCGYHFDIPDDWLDEVGVRDVRLDRRTYPVGKAEPGVRRVALDELDLALDTVLTTLEHRPKFDTPGPFDRERMIPILIGLRDGVPLPPVWVWPIEPPKDGCRFQLFQGHHRYHACVALDLTHIPALVMERDKPSVAVPATPCACGGGNWSCPLCDGTGLIDPA
jgi:hypothetical protein